MEDDKPNWWKRRNWWKISFFVTLIVFEITRELLVISLSEQATPNGYFQVFTYGDWTQATGSWKRTDDSSDPLSPNTTTIECDRAKGECLEVSTSMSDIYVYAPEISRFPAEFDGDIITYRNEAPNCVTYLTRIDTELKKVVAVRTAKPNAKNDLCGKLEPKVEMTLVSGMDATERKDNIEGHFVPILQTMVMVLTWFD